MRIDIITLFPDMLSVLDESIIAKARKKGLLQVCCHQLRDFTPFSSGKVDDTVFGGGKGMLLMAEPIAHCIDSIKEHLSAEPHVVFMSPRGRVLNQKVAVEMSEYENIIIICGHYEGIDSRLLDEYNIEEISIGDYVLTGGELPAAVFTETVSRMIKGVLSDEECFTEESHYNGVLEYPQYTRPELWRGREVPGVLTSGHHENVRKWKRQKSLEITKKNRPDMFEKLELSKEDRKLMGGK